MKSKLLPILLFLMFYSISYAQSYSEKQIDSLLDVAEKTRETKQDEALKLNKEIYSLSVSKAYLIGELKSLDRISHSYYSVGNTDEALKYAVVLEKRATEKKNFQYTALALRLKALCYSKTGLHEESNKTIHTAFRSSEKIPNDDERHKTRAFLYQCKTIIALQKNEKTSITERLDLTQKSISEFSKIKSQKVRNKYLGQEFSTLADNYIQLQKYDSAHFYLKKALYISDKNKSRYEKYTNLCILGKLYYTQEKYTEAIPYFKETIDVAKSANDPYMVRTAYQCLQYTYLMLDEKEKMQDYFNRYTKINDSITKIEKEAVANPFKQILKEKEQSSTKQLFLITSLIILGVILLFLLYRYRQNRLAKKRTLEMERNMQQLEYKALKSQMNPHFVFNVLNNMQSMMILKGEAEVNKYFVAFSKLLRQTLDISNQELVSLKDEIGYLKNYIILNNLQFNEELKFEIIVDKNIIDTEKLFVPGMLIQPFIENALIHGLIPKESDKQLNIHFYIDNGYLVVTIEDNGVGRAASAVASKKKKHIYKSWSTRIVNERVKIINSTKKDSIFVTIEDLNEKENATGTRVIIKFKM